MLQFSNKLSFYLLHTDAAYTSLFASFHFISLNLILTILTTRSNQILIKCVRLWLTCTTSAPLRGWLAFHSVAICCIIIPFRGLSHTLSRIARLPILCAAHNSAHVVFAKVHRIARGRIPYSTPRPFTEWAPHPKHKFRGCFGGSTAPATRQSTAHTRPSVTRHDLPGFPFAKTHTSPAPYHFSSIPFHSQNTSSRPLLVQLPWWKDPPSDSPNNLAVSEKSACRVFSKVHLSMSPPPSLPTRAQLWPFSVPSLPSTPSHLRRSLLSALPVPNHPLNISKSQMVHYVVMSWLFSCFFLPRSTHASSIHHTITSRPSPHAIWAGLCSHTLQLWSASLLLSQQFPLHAHNAPTHSPMQSNPLTPGKKQSTKSKMRRRAKLRKLLDSKKPPIVLSAHLMKFNNIWEETASN